MVDYPVNGLSENDAHVLGRKLLAAIREHRSEARAAMGGLHCGSENGDYRAAHRACDFHSAVAEAIDGWLRR